MRQVDRRYGRRFPSSMWDSLIRTYRVRLSSVGFNEAPGKIIYKGLQERAAICFSDLILGGLKSRNSCVSGVTDPRFPKPQIILTLDDYESNWRQ